METEMQNMAQPSPEMGGEMEMSTDEAAAALGFATTISEKMMMPQEEIKDETEDNEMMKTEPEENPEKEETMKDDISSDISEIKESLTEGMEEIKKQISKMKPDTQQEIEKMREEIKSLLESDE